MDFFPYTSKSMLDYEGDDFPNKGEIGHAPYYIPLIRLVPITNQITNKTSNLKQGVIALRNHFGEQITVVPRGTHGLQLLLSGSDLSKSDEIAVITTFGNHYLSGCVSAVVEQYAQLKRRVTKKTRLVIAVNEWGIRSYRFDILARQCSEQKIPLVEDSCLSMPHNDPTIHDQYPELDYKCLFSFTKVFPMQFGGLIVGVKYPRKVLEEFGIFDSHKTNIILSSLGDYLPNLTKINSKRRQNWQYLHKRFIAKKYGSFFELRKQDVPFLYMLQLKPGAKLKKIKKTINQFGIDCAPYWKNNAIGLPCHQELNEEHLQYIYAVAMKGIADAR
jgi:hypothetical protein